VTAGLLNAGYPSEETIHLFIVCRALPFARLNPIMLSENSQPRKPPEGADCRLNLLQPRAASHPPVPVRSPRSIPTA
jgi:hypothetical protein